MQNRCDSNLYPGGDTVQMYKTKEYLQRLGVEVDISFDYKPDLKGYDAVHLFNTLSMAVADTYLQCLNAKNQGVPVALSTIYYNQDEYESFVQSISPRPLRFAYRHEKLKYALMVFRDLALNGFIEERVKLCWQFGLKNMQRKVLESADVLLPNSEIEYDLISRDFKLKKKYSVIPYCAELFFKDASPEWSIGKYGLRGDFVLCVATRVQPLKNQLSLIRALKGAGIPLVLVGALETRGFIYKKYVRQCLREGSGWVTFIGHLTQAELASVYKAARVHVLPSWFETFGLVSLEAALAGCNIVTTNRGGARDYFKDFAWYCDPADVSSIREAALAAYNGGNSRRAEFERHILDNFTWDKAAEKTLKAYTILR